MVHSIIWGPWLAFGLLLFQLKSQCVKPVYNFWIGRWTLSNDYMKDDFIEIPTDASMMNESMLNEFVLE